MCERELEVKSALRSLMQCCAIALEYPEACWPLEILKEQFDLINKQLFNEEIQLVSKK